MQIYIVPKVIETYKNQFEFSIDKRLIKFINFIKPKKNVEILISKKKIKKKSLIILSGGNNIKKNSKTKADIIRSDLDNFYFNYSKKNNYKIKILGICHGAHFLSSKFGAKLSKMKKINHLKPHKVFINNKSYLVNSFHNFIISSLKNDNLKIIAKAKDGSIEAYVHRNSNLMGIIWHPERYVKFKIFDKKLINKYL